MNLLLRLIAALVAAGKSNAALARSLLGVNGGLEWHRNWSEPLEVDRSGDAD